MEQQRQRILADVFVVVYIPGHYGVRETYDGPQHHEVVVQPEAQLAVARYHDTVFDVVVVQHGHVRFAVVIVRADEPTGRRRGRPVNGAQRRPFPPDDGAVARRPHEIP